MQRILAMALNLKSSAVERLATEVSEMTGESKTEAIRRALEERKQRLAIHLSQDDRLRRLKRFLQEEVWMAIPPRLLGKRLSKKEEANILGYGSEGV
jgi:antitoxin VapB